MKVTDPMKRTRANPLERFDWAVFCGNGRNLTQGAVHVQV